MSNLTESIEKSIKFLRERYPGHGLLTSLESQLAILKSKQESVEKNANQSRRCRN